MKARNLLAAALVSQMLLVSAGRAEWPSDPASWAPADAMVFVGITDLDELATKFKRTAAYAGIYDPVAKELMREISIVMKFGKRLKEQFGKALDIEPGKLANPFGGPMVVYMLTPSASASDPLPIAIVAGVSKHELMKTYYAKATEQFRRLADDHQEISVGLTKIEHFTKTIEQDAEAEVQEDAFDPSDFDFAHMDDEQAEALFDRLFGELLSADSMPASLAYCLTEDRLIVAPTPELVKQALRTAKSDETLRGTEGYRQMARVFEKVGPVRMLVNLTRVYEWAEREGGDEARKGIDAFGLRSARSLIGHIDLAGENFDSKAEMLVSVRGERTGIVKIFSMKNARLSPPETVSRDAIVYAGLNLDFAAIVDEVERIVRQLDAAAADAMRAGLENIPTPEGETINLRKDLFGNLRPPQTIALTMTAPFNPDSAGILISLAHRDREAMARLLELGAGTMPGMITDREIRGTLIYDSMVGGVSAAVTADRLLLGTRSSVERALQPGATADPLVSDEKYRKASRSAPRESWANIYVDGDRLFSAALGFARHGDALKAAMFGNVAAALAYGFVQMMVAGIDEERLDDAKVLGKYRGQSVITVSTTAEGILFSQVQIADPIEKSRP